MNDIVKASNFFKFILYCDDTSLLTSYPSSNSKNFEILLNRQLKNVTKWLESNKLSLNISKTKCMTFKINNKKKCTLPKVYINDQEIELVKNYKFLIIVLDNDLKFKEHVFVVKKRMMSVIAVFARLKNSLPFSVKLKIYNSLIMCHLTYGILIWGKNFLPIEKLQKKALRLVFGFSYSSAHTDYMFKNSYSLKFSDMYKIFLIKFINSFFNKSLPCFMQNLPLAINSEISSYPNTRHSNNLHRIHCHRQSLISIIPIFLNDLNFPQCMKQKILNMNIRYSNSHISKMYKSIIINSYSNILFCNNTNCYPCMKQI